MRSKDQIILENLYSNILNEKYNPHQVKTKIGSMLLPLEEYLSDVDDDWISVNHNIDKIRSNNGELEYLIKAYKKQIMDSMKIIKNKFNQNVSAKKSAKDIISFFQQNPDTLNFDYGDKKFLNHHLNDSIIDFIKANPMIRPINNRVFKNDSWDRTFYSAFDELINSINLYNG